MLRVIVNSIVNRFVVAGVITTMLLIFVVSSAGAANNSEFSQTINAGTLAADIKDDGGVTVGNPSVAMSALTFSFNCQSGGSASTGTFGTNTERLYVTNPDAADNGWTLSVAATNGATDEWDTGTQTFDFNDPTSSGCADSADTDSTGGQLTIDPSGGTLSTDCASCATTSVTTGSSSAFEEGVTDSITLLNAAAGSDDIGRWYLTGTSLSQTIPAETPAGSYSLDMTLTATAQ